MTDHSTDTHARAPVEPEVIPESRLDESIYHLPEETANYFRDVLRLEMGALVELFDGAGRVLRGRLQAVNDRNVVLYVEEEERESRRGESPCETCLVQAIPKGDRWRWVLEKATELGVDRIVPLETERTVVDIEPERYQSKCQRWRRVAGAAARQCGRVRIPQIEGPLPLGEALEAVSATLQLAPHLDSGLSSLTRTLEAAECPNGPIVLWIGPEGGFTPNEVGRLDESGVRPVHLGPRTLRTETAAVVALTCIQRAFGDLSSDSAPSSP